MFEMCNVEIVTSIVDAEKINRIFGSRNVSFVLCVGSLLRSLLLVIKFGN